MMCPCTFAVGRERLTLTRLVAKEDTDRFGENLMQTIAIAGAGRYCTAMRDHKGRIYELSAYATR